jgi:hypothetical protein
MVSLRGVIVHNIEQDLDAGGMQPGDRRAKGVQRVLGRIARLGGKEA